MRGASADASAAARAAAIPAELTVEARAAALERHNAELAQRDALLRGVAEASRILLASPDLSEAMSSAAAVLGARTGCDRVAIFRYEDAGEDSAWWVEAIWEAPGIPSMVATHGRGPLYRRDHPAVCDLHKAGRPWVCHTRDLPEAQRNYNDAIGTLSNAKMPVFTEGVYWGFVAFSDCSGERDWSAGEIHVLEGVGAVLGAAIARARRESEHREALATERAKAAQERAAELARASEALRRSSEQMCSLERLDAFLAHVLESCVPLAGAVAGRLVIAEEADTLRVVSVHPGEETEGEDPEAWPLAPLGPVGAEPGWADLHAPRWPEAWRRWHSARGHSAVFFVPLIVRKCALGYIELAFEDGRRPSHSEIEVLQVLSRQAALGVQLTRLAQDAQQAAVLQERERAAVERAAELARANESLSRSVARLASHGELEDFLSGVLKESLRTTGAPSGAVFVIERGREMLRTGSMVPDGGIDATDVETVWGAVRQENRIHWLRGVLGHRRVAAIPMTANNEPVGFLALGFDEEPLPNDVKMELCRTLAQQATLAVRMYEFAEDAKHSAIAKERADAANARASELAAAAAALRRTGGHLAGTPELTAFVHEVLKEATRHTGATTGGFLRYDESSQTLSLAAAVDESVIDIETDLRFAPLRQPLAFTAKRDWRRLAEGEPVLTDLSPDDALPWPDVTAFHRSMGHRYALAVPVLIGSRIIGCLVLWFVAAEPDACKVELLQALAQQTAVAIHMSELAEHSRHNAVLEERAAFARELHDTLLQGFTGVTLQLRALLRRPPEEPDALYRMLARIERQATDAVQEARSAVGDMRVGGAPSAGEDLVAGLAQLIGDAQAGTDVRLDWTVLGRNQHVSRVVSLAMLRIAREAIGNAIRHGQPATVRVELAFEEGRLSLAVEDDGCGFDPERTVLMRGGHFGLLGMQERAESVGGKYEIRSEPGRGTRIRVEAPL